MSDEREVSISGECEASISGHCLEMTEDNTKCSSQEECFRKPYKRPPLGFNRPGDEYPTEWQVRDGFAREEWRQTGPDEYEVKNPDIIWILPKEGWEAYNNGSDAFVKWQTQHPEHANFRVTNG